MWEEEKLLVWSNFSFSHNVFYTIWYFFFHFICTLKCRLQFVSIWTSLKFCHLVISKPITRQQILDAAKLKKCADDNFTFDENGRKLSKWVENTVGKEEIARYEQFFLFPQCFQKACFAGASKGVIVWEWVPFITKGTNYDLHTIMYLIVW